MVNTVEPLQDTLAALDRPAEELHNEMIEREKGTTGRIRIIDLTGHA